MSNSGKIIAVHSPFKSELINIEDIWAENGVICIRHQGKVRTKSISKTAKEAFVLNQMLKSARKKHPYLVKHREELLEKVLAALREAKSQVENQEKGAVQMQRVLKGQTPDGVPIHEAVGEDGNIEYLREKYPLVKEAEMASILRDTEYSYYQHEQMIAAVHSNRAQIIQQEEAKIL